MESVPLTKSRKIAEKYQENVTYKFCFLLFKRKSGSLKVHDLKLKFFQAVKNESCRPANRKYGRAAKNIY